MIYLISWTLLFLVFAYIIYSKIIINRFFKLIFLSWMYLNGVFLIYMRWLS